MSAGAPRLRVEGVDVDLGGRPVLRGLDLEVHEGEVLAVLGPNGAGKTTFLRTLLGLLRPRSGQVRVRADGADPDRWTTVRPGALGYVPQRHDFAWELPVLVREAVLGARVGLRPWWRGAGVEDHRATARALEKVALTDLAARPIGELSGGQRQRVLVARALATDTAVLLLDEPFTGLDLPTQELLSELFTTLARTGTSVVMTTHDLTSAIAASDRLALLRGRVRAVGPVGSAALQDPDVWAETFEVGPDSPFLAALGLGLRAPERSAVGAR